MAAPEPFQQASAGASGWAIQGSPWLADEEPSRSEALSPRRDGASGRRDGKLQMSCRTCKSDVSMLCSGPNCPAYCVACNVNSLTSPSSER